MGCQVITSKYSKFQIVGHLEVLLLDRVWWKIVVALDLLGLVTFRQHGAICKMQWNLSLSADTAPSA